MKYIKYNGYGILIPHEATHIGRERDGRIIAMFSKLRYCKTTKEYIGGTFAMRNRLNTDYWVVGSTEIDFIKEGVAPIPVSECEVINEWSKHDLYEGSGVFHHYPEKRARSRKR
ncbi:MAG: hypothetical protein LPH21_18435 [Shewanella sp.]|nr:hypothetical protein [Shewanella sp.]